MRLHRLRVTAFQPYAGDEEVDFEALGEAGLFLMQGETGAGKTAILDAVCFALFGHVPGVRDGASRLRSDHSAAGDRTEVELELTLGGRRLRVTRSPKQERPKVRGEGTTEEPARATLEVEGPDGHWAVLAERIEAVEHELAGMLGLTLTQFCQVVLLPQGAFARFLHATTDEREQILQQLFATDRYAAAESWLADQRRLADRELGEGLGSVADVASRVAQVAGEEPPQDWREQPEALQGWLATRRVLAEAREATAGGRRDAALEAHGRAAAAAQAAATLAEHQARARAAGAALAEHEKRRGVRDCAAATARSARRAESVALPAQHAQAARAGLSAAQARADGALERATAEVEPAAGQLTMAGAGVTPEQARARAAEYEGQAAVVRSRTGLEQRLQGGEENVRRLEGELAREDHALGANRKWLEEAASRQEQLEAELAEARAAQAALPGVEQAHHEAERRAAAGRRRDEITVDVRNAETKVAEARGAELTARQTWLEARERRLEGIAAELAGDLCAGEPCRVCGAVEHPLPATHDDGVPVTAEGERELQRRAEQAAQEHSGERVRLAGLERELAGARAVAGEEPADSLAEASRAAAEALSEQRVRAEALPGAEQALENHRAQARARERQAAEQADRCTGLRAELTRRQEELAEIRDEVQSARGGHETLAARVQHLERRASEWTGAAEALADLEAAAGAARQRQSEAEQAALARGFTSADEAMSVALPAEEIIRLEAEVEGYDQELAALRARLEDPELSAAAAQQAPDVEAAREALRAAEAELAESQRGLGGAERQRRDLRALSEDLDHRLEGLAPLLERQRLVRAVSGLVDGSSVANRLRMPLAAYVLAARLEQIAQAASQRLERMSGGRYVLAHCDERVGRSRKAGLGLQVLDAWTGRERPPGSLSGGETFQASLALALGLADVVGAEAGGARLETLFVDEGFGSLGEEALDDVLDVLDGLREGGRAVGVISHVPELRQRIPVQLHVKKGRRGSHIVQR